LKDNQQKGAQGKQSVKKPKKSNSKFTGHPEEKSNINEERNDQMQAYSLDISENNIFKTVDNMVVTPFSEISKAPSEESFLITIHNVEKLNRAN
jgi:hypothetical protein